jgi:hypothetical protein
MLTNLLFKEGRKSSGSGRATFCVLQLCEAASDDPHDVSNGGECQSAFVVD